MSFKQRVHLLIASIILTVVMLVSVLAGFSYYLMDKTTTAYQQGEQLTKTVNTARQAHISFQRQVQEWKNILIRGNDPELKAKYYKQFGEQEAKMDERLNALIPLLQQQKLDPLVIQTQQILYDHKNLGQKYRGALESHPTLDWAGQQAVDVSLRGIDRPTSQGMDSLVEQIETKVNQQFTNTLADEKNNMVKKLLTLGILASLVTLGLTALLIKMMKNLFDMLGDEPEHVVQATARIAKGDLTENLQAEKPTSLIGSLEMMQLRLRNISLAITASADDLKNQTYALNNNKEREVMLATLKKVYDAIARIKTERE